MFPLLPTVITEWLSNERAIWMNYSTYRDIYCGEDKRIWLFSVRVMSCNDQVASLPLRACTLSCLLTLVIWLENRFLGWILDIRLETVMLPSHQNVTVFGIYYIKISLLPELLCNSCYSNQQIYHQIFLKSKETREIDSVTLTDDKIETTQMVKWPFSELAISVIKLKVF